MYKMLDIVPNIAASLVLQKSFDHSEQVEQGRQKSGPCKVDKQRKVMFQGLILEYNKESSNRTVIVESRFFLSWPGDSLIFDFS